MHLNHARRTPPPTISGSFGARVARYLVVLLLGAALFASGCESEKPAAGQEEAHAGHDHDETGEEGHAEEGQAEESHAHEEEAGEARHEGHEGEEGHEEEGEHGDEAVVALNPKAVERSGIRLGEAMAAELGAAVEVPAEVHFNPNRLAHVTPLVPGQLVDVFVDLGDEVKAGQPLAKFRSVEFGEARAELERTRSMISVAEANFARQEKLRDLGIASERSFLEARQKLEEVRAERGAARARLAVMGAGSGGGADDVIRAPIAGTIVERHATRGEYVRPEDKLFVVGDLSEVWVMGRVPEREVGGIDVGDPTTISLKAYPGRTWDGAVDYVGNRLDETTRTLEIRSEVSNTDGALRPGLFGTMAVRTASAPSGGAAGAVLVPEGAVQELDGGSVVFVPEGEAKGSFRALPVVLGARSSGRVEIVEGLKPGQPVVVEGAFVLKSQKMRGELGHGHAH